MSYSFQFVAPTKDEAKIKVVAEFENVVAQQPIHARDQAAAIAAAHAFIDLLDDAEGKYIQVACHGSVSYYSGSSDAAALAQVPLSGAAGSVSAYLVTAAE